MLDGCGHSPHIDQREAVERTTVRFLVRRRQGFGEPAP
jgi:pimeloyl-ACP methyl ester carboxylesterase